jgi:hypothetical protein
MMNMRRAAAAQVVVRPLCSEAHTPHAAGGPALHLARQHLHLVLFMAGTAWGVGWHVLAPRQALTCSAAATDNHPSQQLHGRMADLSTALYGGAAKVRQQSADAAAPAATPHDISTAPLLSTAAVVQEQQQACGSSRGSDGEMAEPYDVDALTPLHSVGGPPDTAAGAASRRLHIRPAEASREAQCPAAHAVDGAGVLSRGLQILQKPMQLCGSLVAVSQAAAWWSGGAVAAVDAVVIAAVDAVASVADFTTVDVAVVVAAAAVVAAAVGAAAQRP